MNRTKFIAHCPFEMDDKLKIVLDKDKNILSNETYTVSDIKTIHYHRTGVVEFKIVVKDYMNRDLAERNIDDFKLIS